MDVNIKAGGNATTVEQPKSQPRRPPQRQRSRLLAGEGRGDGRIQAHHRRGQPRPRSRPHHLSGRPGKKPGAAVREHQGPSRPQGALQHDRLQPVAVLPDDRRGAGRSSAQGGEAPAEEVRAQDGAGRGAGRRSAVSQPEHRRGRQDRHPHVPGAADVAARRRHVSRHRRRRHHQGSGDRPRQRRHLPDDDQGPARDRRLHLARQGRRRRPRQVVEDGQARADRGGLRHRPAAVPGRRHEPAEDRERVRILFRHQGLADRAVHLRPHRPAAAGACRDHPRGPSLSGRDLRRRPVRRVHRLLRPAERRHALHARRAAALPQQSDAGLRADGRRAVERVRAVLGGGALRRHLGRPAESSASPASRACGRSPKPPAGA